jgi:ferrous iron transport protein A
VTAELPPNAAGDRSLATLHKGEVGVVTRLLGDDAEMGDGTGATVVMRLLEIGFVPGERVEVVAEVRPGGDPIAVRVGGSCFALRRQEAVAVMVGPPDAGGGLA